MAWRHVLTWLRSFGLSLPWPACPCPVLFLFEYVIRWLTHCKPNEPEGTLNESESEYLLPTGGREGADELKQPLAFLQQNCLLSTCHHDKGRPPHLFLSSYMKFHLEWLTPQGPGSHEKRPTELVDEIEVWMNATSAKDRWLLFVSKLSLSMLQLRQTSDVLHWHMTQRHRRETSCFLSWVLGTLFTLCLMQTCSTKHAK